MKIKKNRRIDGQINKRTEWRRKDFKERIIEERIEELQNKIIIIIRQEAIWPSLSANTLSDFTVFLNNLKEVIIS